MHYYFSAGYPAVIKINGIFKGDIYTKLKDVVDCDGAFIEVCPLIDSERQTNLMLTQEFLSLPTHNASVTDLKGGYLIKFNPTYKTNGFSVIAQEKFNDAIVTVFTENGYNLSIETKTDFYTENLPFEINSASVERVAFQGANILAITLLGIDKTLAVFSLDNKITKLYCDNVESYSFDSCFNTTVKYKDIAKHQITCRWNLTNDKLILTEQSATFSQDFSVDNLPEQVLPFAFLEDLLVGGDFYQYLSDSLKANADKLKGFFGEFIGVIPPPEFHAQDRVGLVYKQCQNKYFVEYFTFKIQDRKIANITKI